MVQINPGGGGLEEGSTQLVSLLGEVTMIGCVVCAISYIWSNEKEINLECCNIWCRLIQGEGEQGLALGSQMMDY